jgi:hypothetical protein
MIPDFGKYHHREKEDYSKYGNLEDIISSILLKQINKIISPKIRYRSKNMIKIIFLSL